MLLCMNQLLFDDEEYYFQITDELESDRLFILIIYDIVDNKRRTKFAKLLEGYGKRVQKSAFEAMLSEKNYYKLIDQIPAYIDRNGEDSVRVYKITGKGKVKSWGIEPVSEEEIILVYRKMKMGKKYLFSPVGNTDPIKYFHDGSLLHICRHYQPDVVYLYLSKEMIENHKKDNRYVRSVELLSEKINHNIEVHVIENSDMIDVQQYDVFFTEFRKIIGEIEKQKNNEDILLVNMASGTPAMKSALLVMATLAEYRFIPIQVSTPKKKGNLEYEDRDDYDVETNWELNEDNRSEAENRCHEIKCMNLMRLLKIDIIKKHLLSYDYRAALEVGKDIKDDISPEIYNWLEAAAARSVLDWNKMNKALPKGNGIVTPVKTDDVKRSLFEYTLILDLKLKRGEYADFIRAFTPLGVDLMESVIEQYCEVNISDYYKGKNSAKQWNQRKLESSEILPLLQGDFSRFNFGPVYSIQLVNLIEAKCSDDLLKQRARELVTVEQNTRNIAAHNIVSVTEKWVKEQTGKSVSVIMWLIKYICSRVKINIREENWNSYDKMNTHIIKLLDEL